MATVNLEELTDRGRLHNLSGKERGEQARSHFNLDSLDEQGGVVVVKVPEYVYALSSSFFLGLFSPTIKKIGERGFREMYKFDASPLILRQVEHGLVRCISSRASLH